MCHARAKRGATPVDAALPFIFHDATSLANSPPLTRQKSPCVSYRVLSALNSLKRASQSFHRYSTEPRCQSERGAPSTVVSSVDLPRYTVLIYYVVVVNINRYSISISRTMSCRSALQGLKRLAGTEAFECARALVGRAK